MDYNITDEDLDNAFDTVSPDDDVTDIPDETDIDPDNDGDDDSDDVNADDIDFDDDDQDYEYQTQPDDITDAEMAEDGISENDLVVVNKDGSYVVMSQDMAELLMSNPDFIDKMDAGFDDIDDFTNTIQPILQATQND